MMTIMSAITFFSPTVALADPPVTVDYGTIGITNVLCNVIGVAQGNTGKTIAILVVISIAIGLFLGKITWGVAIAVAVGMGVLFGAGPMVFAISGINGKGADFKTACPNNII